MATLEGLTARYAQILHGAPSQSGATHELEVRFDQVSYATFEHLLTELLARDAPAHSCTLDTVRRVRAPAADQAYVWERAFLPNGERRDAYRLKTRLAPPVRVRGEASYRVALSREEPTEPFAVTGVVFRFKNRVSFARLVEGWRVDLTLVREFPESSAHDLRRVVKEIFPAGQTPATLLASLSLTAGAAPTAQLLANQQLYTYEVEVEHTGATAPGAADVQAAAFAVLQHAGQQPAPQARAELHQAASLFISAPALLQKYASGEWGLKQLTPPAESQTRGQYAEIYPPLGFHVTGKADGVHALALAQGGRLAVVAPGLEAGSLLEYGLPPPPPGARAPPPLGLTIVEGEIVAAAAPPALLFLAFDVLSLQGTNLTARPFEERLKELAPAAAALQAYTAPAAAPPLRVAAKPYYPLESPDPAHLAAQFQAAYNAAGLPYALDGLVLYGPGQPYAKTPIYKWKPLEANTIDFLARRPPATVLGRAPFIDRPGHRLYFLYTGVSQEVFRQQGLSLNQGYREMFPAHRQQSAYFPCPFQPADQPWAYLFHCPQDKEVENRVVELRLRAPDQADGQRRAGAPADAPHSLAWDPAPAWELVRVRADRDEDLAKGRLFGNNLRTAELTWLNYRSPFTLEMLSQGPGGGYFAADKAGTFRAPTAFVSFCKSAQVNQHLAGLAAVVDLGAGRGQDGGRYLNAQVGMVVLVDRDVEALAEAVRRKYEWAGRGGGGTTFHAQRGDFTAPHPALAERLRALPGFPAEGANAVVCNLAAHYAFGSREGMRNFVQLGRALLRPGGVALLVVLDGQRVLTLLQDVPLGKTWDAREGGRLKYSVRRDFHESKLTPAGQKIGVLLPFSDGRYYEEYLTNVKELVATYQALGFRLVQQRNLLESYEASFREHNRAQHAALTEHDRTWVGLLTALVLAYEPKK